MLNSSPCEFDLFYYYDIYRYTCREVILKQPTWRVKEKLELIHSYVGGSIRPASNGGTRYFITFTYDFSRKTWIYFSHEKACAFDVFKQLKALVEKESDLYIKCLRKDKGEEFTSNTVCNFCSLHGIKRQLTIVYTPQQKGVLEIKNRTLMNMIRSVMTSRNVPKSFWTEAAKFDHM